jgi:hypothetical protein
VASLALVAPTPPSPDYQTAWRDVLAERATWRFAYMYARMIAFSTNVTPGPDIEEFRGRSDAEVEAQVRHYLTTVGIFSEATTTADIHRWLGAYRATIIGFLGYTPARKFSGRALLVEPAAQNPFHSSDKFVSQRIPAGDWSQHLDGQLVSRSVQSNHYAMMTKPWAQEVAEQLDQWLSAEALP